MIFPKALSLISTFFPLLETCLKILFSNGLQLRCRVLYFALSAIKAGPFSDIFSFGNSTNRVGSLSYLENIVID